MKITDHGFYVPEYTDIADIPTLIALNVAVMEKLIAEVGKQTIIDGGSYTDVTGDVIDAGIYGNY